jgi:hypothetical protein
MENVFEEPGVLGFSLSNCANSYKVIIVSLEANVPPGVSETTQVKLHGTPCPPTLRMKCRVLKISKCIWLGCHVVASP